jgi:hypothetical protein
MSYDLVVSRARLCCAAFAAAVALPAAAQQAPAGANGAMSFPNARMVQGSPAASAPAAEPATATGLRAFRDPETNALAEPTASEAAALQSQLPQASRKPSRKALRVFRLAGGRGEGVELDESFMSNTVVRKADDGRLAEACVVGDELAERLIRMGGPVALPARGGVQ